MNEFGWRRVGKVGTVERCDQRDAAVAELFAAEGPALLCVEQDVELL
jgi:hypothetical protein